MVINSLQIISAKSYYLIDSVNSSSTTNGNVNVSKILMNSTTSISEFSESFSFLTFMNSSWSLINLEEEEESFLVLLNKTNLKNSLLQEAALLNSYNTSSYFTQEIESKLNKTYDDLIQLYLNFNSVFLFHISYTNLEYSIIEEKREVNTFEIKKEMKAIVNFNLNLTAKENKKNGVTDIKNFNIEQIHENLIIQKDNFLFYNKQSLNTKKTKVSEGEVNYYYFNEEGGGEVVLSKLNFSFSGENSKVVFQFKGVERNIIIIILVLFLFSTGIKIMEYIKFKKSFFDSTIKEIENEFFLSEKFKYTKLLFRAHIKKLQNELNKPPLDENKENKG